MIPVANPTQEPDEFDVRCRIRGNNWLKNHPDSVRPRDYWSDFRLQLAEGFVDRCAYGAMWISSGTVDHHASWDEEPGLAYEWDNYRYVEGWLNSSKANQKASTLLDPFDVGKGWFKVLLPSLQLVLTDKVPDEFRERAEHTLRSLPLVHDVRILRTRSAWLKMYEEGAPLKIIWQKAPLVAEAIVRENWPRMANRDGE